MRTTLLLALIALLFLPLRAEDWTTTDGKTYKDVKVLRSNPAFVTILHDDGGGQIPLNILTPDLQKRFDYDPAKAAAFLAAAKAAEEKNKEALVQEKARIQAQQEEADKEVAAAIALAVYTPPPSDDSTLAASDAPQNGQFSDGSAIPSEPPTQIDDYGWYDDGYYGYGYGYAYPYGSGYGRSHGSHGHNGSHFTHH